MAGNAICLDGVSENVKNIASVFPADLVSKLISEEGNGFLNMMNDAALCQKLQSAWACFESAQATGVSTDVQEALNELDKNLKAVKEFLSKSWVSLAERFRLDIVQFADQAAKDVERASFPVDMVGALKNCGGTLHALKAGPFLRCSFNFLPVALSLSLVDWLAGWFIDSEIMI